MRKHCKARLLLQQDFAYLIQQYGAVPERLHCKTEVFTTWKSMSSCLFPQFLMPCSLASAMSATSIFSQMITAVEPLREI